MQATEQLRERMLASLPRFRGFVNFATNPGDSPNHAAHFRWLASKRSPLAARVAVNRVWQAIFGTGLVETAEDFGARTPVPEYLDLLDWLAVDFMEHGWSHKHLIETIVTSETYQQSAAVTPLLLERDPRNRWLTRGARFRMDAEVIRDTTLSIAGLLYLKEVGGASIFPSVPKNVLDYNYVKPTYWIPPEGPERYRRALYVVRKRSMPDPALSSFDAPNGDIACAPPAALQHAAFRANQPQRDHVRRSFPGTGVAHPQGGGQGRRRARPLRLLAMHRSLRQACRTEGCAQSARTPSGSPCARRTQSRSDRFFEVHQARRFTRQCHAE